MKDYVISAWVPHPPGLIIDGPPETHELVVAGYTGSVSEALSGLGRAVAGANTWEAERAAGEMRSAADYGLAEFLTEHMGEDYNWEAVDEAERRVISVLRAAADLICALACSPERSSSGPEYRAYLLHGSAYDTVVVIDVGGRRGTALDTTHNRGLVRDFLNPDPVWENWAGGELPEMLIGSEERLEREYGTIVAAREDGGPVQVRDAREFAALMERYRFVLR